MATRRVKPSPRPTRKLKNKRIGKTITLRKKKKPDFSKPHTIASRKSKKKVS